MFPKILILFFCLLPNSQQIWTHLAIKVILFHVSYHLTNFLNKFPPLNTSMFRIHFSYYL